ncbi:MAG TPA: carotenoid oxygenase family protein, partial [Acidimicrobiales bacterium]
RVGVMPLGGPASAIGWVDVDPCYVFHGTNAYRDGQRVVLDVCRLPSVFKDGGDLEPSATHRWTVDLSGASPTLDDTPLDDTQMDLPGIDRRFVGRPYRYGWYAAVEQNGDYGFEFAPRGPDESDGWLLCFAYDRTRDASDVVVLDAMDVAAGPVARIKLPSRVPYGFHGWWVADA